MRMSLMVDMDALNVAIANAPLTASTAFPIYEAIGFYQVEKDETQSHSSELPRQPLNPEAPCSSST